tara:strand:+ start:414 stop:848 length:435 start_codon:yes stop_codon:yes gene_type:complete
MKILLIEDNPQKLLQIENFIVKEVSSAHLTIKKSYNSGLREIMSNKDYSLILLDMSLPNYDIEAGESGGDFEKYAGKYLLNEMYRREINISVVIITMYLNYVDEEFTSELKDDFPNYLGVIYYDIKEPDSWKNKLKDHLRKTDA